MKIAIAGSTGAVGRHVVDSADQAGHEVIGLSRGDGVDLVSGSGLADALRGAEVIVDVANAGTAEEQPATEFFTAEAANLQRFGAEAGVEHIVTLSIVGVERAPVGYYAAKLEHERVAQEGPVPSTLQRSTQFHELPAQLLAMGREDSRAQVFDLHVRSIAARSVGAALVGVAEGGPQVRAQDLGGPQEANLVDLARAFVARRGEQIEVVADTESMAGVPKDALLPGPEARIEGPTFEQWLASEDAAALPL